MNSLSTALLRRGRSVSSAVLSIAFSTYVQARPPAACTAAISTAASGAKLRSVSPPCAAAFLQLSHVPHRVPAAFHEPSPSSSSSAAHRQPLLSL
eukprot:7780-Prymnesium_polylepis.1